MDRRDAVKRVGLMMGGALSAPAISAILNGCTPKPEPLSWQPSFFSEEQARAITDLTDIFLPKTETPGGVELGIPQFIEEMVSQIYNEDYRTRFMNGFTEFLGEVKTSEGEDFYALGDDAKVKIVKETNEKSITVPLPPASERGFMLLFKELMLVGYCTTEVGATEVLQYEAIPQDYKGCIPLSEAGGRTWAT